MDNDDGGSKNCVDGNLSFELPRLNGIRKNLNLSPRRKIITLKLPKVELSPRSKQGVSFPRSINSEKSEGFRHLSMSVECTVSQQTELLRRSPVRSNNNCFLLNLEDSNCLKYKRTRLSSLQAKLNQKLKLQRSNKFGKVITKSTQNEEILVKGESKPSKHTATVQITESALCNMACKFKESVENKYMRAFEEIDINKSGSIVLDDIINMIIYKGLNEDTEKEESYILLKKKSLDIFYLFYLVSSKNRIGRKDFFAVCAIYEYYSPGMEMADFLKIENLVEVKNKIIDLKQVFEFYAKEGVIDQKQFKSILACVHVDDISALVTVLFAETVGFARFLSFLPLFLWVHQEVTGQFKREISEDGISK